MQNFIHDVFLHPNDFTRGVVFLAAALLVSVVIIIWRVTED